MPPKVVDPPALLGQRPLGPRTICLHPGHRRDRRPTTSAWAWWRAAELLDWDLGFAVLQGANASPYDAAGGFAACTPACGCATSRPGVAARCGAGGRPRPPRCYLGLASHPQHDLARRQMRPSGGQLTFDLVGGAEAGSASSESTRSAVWPRRSAALRPW